MKTLIDVKLELEDLKQLASLLDPYFDKSKLKRTKKRILWLKQCLLFSETNPDADYLRIQLRNLKDRIRIIEERIPSTLSPHNPTDKKEINYIKRMYDYKGISDKIKFINYMLS